jgi:hypothetical protein
MTVPGLAREHLVGHTQNLLYFLIPALRRVGTWMVIGRRSVSYTPPMTRAFESVAFELGAVVGDHCLWVKPTAKHFILQQPDGRLGCGPLHGKCFDPASEEVCDNKYILVALCCVFVWAHVINGDGLPGPVRVVGVKRGARLHRSSFHSGADQAVLHVRPNVATILSTRTPYSRGARDCSLLFVPSDVLIPAR